MPDALTDPDTPDEGGQRPPQYRRRAFLRAGADAGWWVYESENPPHTVTIGTVVYAADSYTVRLPDGERVTLPAVQVDALAREYGSLTTATVSGQVRHRVRHLAAEAVEALTQQKSPKRRGKNT